jgi:endo-1,4-beta-xylanase
VKTHFYFLALLVLVSGCATQGISQGIPASIALWPGGAPGSEGRTAPEVTGVQNEPATQYVDGFSFAIVSSVNNPSVTPFLPDPSKATGAAVIVIPGGGHKFLAIEHEGYAVARVLADHGVAAFVLKYRLAKEANSPYKVEVHALMDVQRAIRLVRANSAQWGVDPHRVGVMGFSAGGELAVLSVTRFETPVAGTSDATDQLSCRPDFAALMYPGGTTDTGKMALPKNMPPEFLACAYNDRPAMSINLANLYVRLKQAEVPAEMHIYASGGHGFGVRPDKHNPAQGWIVSFVDWLGDRGMLIHK